MLKCGVHTYLLIIIIIVVHIQDGWTALHSAAGNGQFDVVDFLMDINPDTIRQVDNVSV